VFYIIQKKIVKMSSPNDPLTRLRSCVDLPLDEKVLKELVEKGKDFLLMHGILIEIFKRPWLI